MCTVFGPVNFARQMSSMNGIIHAKELYRTDPNVRRNTIQNAFLALIESTKTLTDYFKNKGKLNFDNFSGK